MKETMKWEKKFKRFMKQKKLMPEEDSVNRQIRRK
jgi:hypothetical protein